MMNIILAGYIANEATYRLIQREKPALSCRFSDRFIRLTEEMALKNHIKRDSITCVTSKSGIDISEEDIMELSETGILGGLWEFSEKHSNGLEVYLNRMSIRQETVEVFECLDVNPYTYPSQGSWIIRSDRAYELVEMLNRSGIRASVIGQEKDNNDRIVINGEETRFLTPIDRLLKDEQGMRNMR